MNNPVEEVAVQELTAVELPTQHSDKKFMVEMSDLGSMNTDSLEAQLNKMNGGSLKKSAFNVAVQYYDFEMNKPMNFMFLGITQMTTQDGELLPAVMMCDGLKNTYTNQAAILVDAIIKAKLVVGKCMEVCWTGVKKTSKGNQVRLFSVFPLIDNEQ
jgi:hypothetical protein